MPHTAVLREILGIPDDQQPASYYRLLGLSPENASPEAVENAAYRQAMRAKTFQEGPWESAVEPVLALIEEARSCLVDPARRAEYDRSRASGVASAGVAATPNEDQDPRHAPGRATQQERSVWTLGASEECDIVIDDPYVSRRHCRIVLEDGRYYIEDLDSCNGTFIDGERVVKRKELSMNDSIGLGKTLRIAWGQFVTMQQRKRERPDKPVLVHVARRTICYADGRPLVPALDAPTSETQHEPDPAQAAD